MKTRAAKGIRAAVPALIALAAGCAHAYEDPTTDTYIMGTIFLVLGLALGVALIMSLD